MLYSYFINALQHYRYRFKDIWALTVSRAPLALILSVEVVNE